MSSGRSGPVTRSMAQADTSLLDSIIPATTAEQAEEEPVEDDLEVDDGEGDPEEPEGEPEEGRATPRRSVATAAAGAAAAASAAGGLLDGLTWWQILLALLALGLAVWWFWGRNSGAA